MYSRTRRSLATRFRFPRIGELIDSLSEAAVFQRLPLPIEDLSAVLHRL